MRKSKKELQTSMELSQILYFNFIPNKEIAERVGVSQQTITAWVNDNNWKEKRAAKTITRTELINKTLERINGLLHEEGSLNADKLVKLSALIEKLDKKNSPVLSMEVFISFSKWLSEQAAFDKDLSVDFLKKLNKYQDSFISTIMSQ